MQADTRSFDVWLGRTTNLLGRGVGEVIREESALLAYDVARITPPTTGTMSFSQPWGAQKKAGVAAVRRDIAKVYATTSEIYAKLRAKGERGEDAAKGAAKAIRQDDLVKLRSILQGFGVTEFLNADVGLFNPSYHEKGRVKNGRVARNRKRALQIVKNRASLTAYTRGKVKSVGSLKRGWMMASRRLQSKKRWPAWVKNATAGTGRMIDNSRSRKDPFISIINTTDYAGAQNSLLRYTDKAVRYRQGVFVRKMKAKAKRVWKN